MDEWAADKHVVDRLPHKGISVKRPADDIIEHAKVYTIQEALVFHSRNSPS